MQHDGMKGAVFVGTKKVIPAEQCQAVGGTSPSVYQEQDKMFQVAGADTIVHPWTVVTGGKE